MMKFNSGIQKTALYDDQGIPVSNKRAIDGDEAVNAILSSQRERQQHRMNYRVH